MLRVVEIARALDMLKRQAVVGFLDGVGHRARNFVIDGENDRFHTVAVLEGFPAHAAKLFHKVKKF